jgi:hypothetical protein
MVGTFVAKDPTLNMKTAKRTQIENHKALRISLMRETHI